MAEKKEIKDIRVLRNCGASGKSLEAEQVYSVPGEVSREDAEVLIRMMKAQPVEKNEKSSGKKKASGK